MAEPRAVLFVSNFIFLQELIFHFSFHPLRHLNNFSDLPRPSPPAEYLKAGVVSWVWRVTFGEAEGSCVRPVLFVVQILCAFLFDSHHFTK